MCVVLSSKMEEKLINSIRARPALYDKTKKDFSNRDVVNSMWIEVAAEANIRGLYLLN